jgi:hypothetical protein
MRIEDRPSILHLPSSICLRFLDALIAVCYRNDSYKQARFKCKNLMYWSLAVELQG